MDAAFPYSRFVLIIPPCFIPSKQLKLGRRPFHSLIDEPLVFCSAAKDVPELSVSKTRSDTSRRGRVTRGRSSIEGKPRNKANRKLFQSSESNGPSSSKREEIIALFRRIRFSISKEDTTGTPPSVSNEEGTPDKNANSSPEKSAAKPVLDIILQARNQSKVLPVRVTRKRTVQNKDQRHTAPKGNITRLPSNFAKRSPIPSPSPPREQAIDNELELTRIKEMKLPKLKELAKSRGLKGYSKLKKSELLELLGS